MQNSTAKGKDSERITITKPLLTIAIPTYNRAGCLTELLSLISDQLKDESRVELMISDNASPDETPAVVEDFVSRGLRIRYLRNEKNVGPDGNFLQCFEQARGKYVWVFSDDDLIIPGAIAKILKYCESGDYDLIWLGAYGFQESHHPAPANSGRNAIEITDAAAYAKRMHVFFTFISGNIINKDTVLAAGSKPFSDLIGTGLVQLGWTYTAMNRFSRGLFIQEELIGVRLNNTGGYKLSQVFGITLSAVTQKWLESPTIQRIVMNGTIQRFWPPLLLEYKKEKSTFSQEANPRQVLTQVFKDNARFWIFAYPVMVLPAVPAKAWVFLTRVINRLDRAAGFPSLTWGASRAREKYSA